ncbi:DNA-directed RNA polymerase subunit H [Candidatus Woesearchaeota archaeon]|nr:DNA-directed RNA polymerase subunit H [Candidatus Woesearchaeota archaeon]
MDNKHALVPKHTKLSEKEKKELLEKYNIDTKDLPRIFMNDPAIQKLDAKEGDVVKVTRTSPTALESMFYRRVVNA